MIIDNVFFVCSCVVNRDVYKLCFSQYFGINNFSFYHLFTNYFLHLFISRNKTLHSLLTEMGQYTMFNLCIKVIFCVFPVLPKCIQAAHKHIGYRNGTSNGKKAMVVVMRPQISVRVTTVSSNTTVTIYTHVLVAVVSGNTQMDTNSLYTQRRQYTNTL